jgi:hypothetical protein
MIYPVKIFNKHGELTKTISVKQLKQERENGDQKLSYRARFNHMVRPKKQKTGKVTPRKRNAASQTKRKKYPVRSGRSRAMDGSERQEIDPQIESIINTIRNILGG